MYPCRGTGDESMVRISGDDNGDEHGHARDVTPPRKRTRQKKIGLPEKWEEVWENLSAFLAPNIFLRPDHKLLELVILHRKGTPHSIRSSNNFLSYFFCCELY